MNEKEPGFHFLQMEECIAAIDESIQQLLDLMISKGTQSGNLAIKLSFDLSDTMATENETGEMVTLYSPAINFEIKKRIRLEVEGVKGRQPHKGEIWRKDGRWIEADMGQLTIFD